MLARLSKTFFCPGKVFVLGEYACLAGKPALVATTKPHFKLQILPNENFKMPFHPLSPAGRLLLEHQKILQKFSFKWADPYSEPIGVGSSSAQFLLSIKALLWIKKKPFPSLEKLLAAYWKYSLPQTKFAERSSFGIRPSGFDLLAQSLGSVHKISSPQNTKQLGPWRGDAIWGLIFTGKKVKTHEHLLKLKKIGFPRNYKNMINDLHTITENGIDAWEKKNSLSLSKNLKEYQRILSKTEIVPKNFTQLIEKIQNIPGVLGVKGSGVQGGDSILVLYTQSKKTSIENTAGSLHLKFIPCKF